MLYEENKEQVKCKMSMCASITVENTFLMPLILACIVLLIIMNGYLHDLVILNGMSVEVLYAESGNREMLLQEETQGRLFWLSNTVFSETEDPFKRKITWKNNYSFPLNGLLNMIIDKKELELSGEVQKQAWSMSQIIRYVDQNQAAVHISE